MNKKIVVFIMIFALLLSCSPISAKVTDTAKQAYTKLSQSNYAGASYSAVIKKKIYAITVLNTNQVYLEAYDPVKNTWTKLSRPSINRFLFSVVTVNDKIYVLGGATTSYNTYTDIVEEYNPATDKWTKKAPMKAKRMNAPCIVAGKKIYCFDQGIIDEYNPKTDKWTTVCSDLMERHGAGIAAIGSKLYIAGGATLDAKSSLADVEEFDTSTGKLSKRADMASAVNYPLLQVYKNKLYQICGTDSQGVIGTTDIQVYDPQKDKWSLRKSTVPFPRADGKAVLLNGKLYTIGGWYDNKFVDDVEEYDLVKDKWTIKTSLPGIRNYHCAEIIDNKIYIFGGKITYEVGLKSAYAYDPSADK